MSTYHIPKELVIELALMFLPKDRDDWREKLEQAHVALRDSSLLLRPDEFLSCILDATVLEVTHNPLGILFQHQHMGAGCIA